MPAFVRVSGEKAGPEALGILVPPGRRTLVVLRPRSVNWDLVAVHPDGNGAAGRFLELGRADAVRLAEELAEKLRESSETRVEAVPSRDGIGYWVRVQAAGFAMQVCGRVPGTPYRPALFADRAEADQIAVVITALLAPTRQGEIYTNTNQFSR